MAVKRIFLDWSRPALVAAAEYLVERFATPGSVDLQNVVVALPGGRAGRRLLEILLDLTERKSLVLVPPKIVTAGKLPELLYRAKRPFADTFTQQLAWIEAINRSEPEYLDRLGLGRVESRESRVESKKRKAENGKRKENPQPSSLNSQPSPLDSRLSTLDFSGRLAIGDMLRRLHAELAADGLDCEGVAEHGAALEGFREAERWRALAHVQKRYLETLDAQGLWDLQTARLFAIENRECETDAEIVLVGTVDLNRSQRQMLDQVADRVTALVFAPLRLADDFDEHGCLLADNWQDRGLSQFSCNENGTVPFPSLGDEQIEVVQRPADQAQAVVRAIAAWDGRYAAEEITVGMPDDRIVPYVRQQLQQCGVAVRYGAGEPILKSPPARLLAAVADYLEGQRFAALAALVRHPAVDAWLLDQGVSGDWLSRLDKYHEEHLPYRVKSRESRVKSRESRVESEESEVESRESSIQEGSFLHVLPAIANWLGELAGVARPLDQWARRIVDVLVAVFGREPLEPNVAADRTVLVACEKIYDVLKSHTGVPGALMPTVAGAEAVRLVLRQVAAETIAPLPDHGAVELLGWLELALDDAPALVVTGMNEGIVPSSLNADMFLPNRLRRALGLEDNHRRYARDAYALAVLAASRKELKLIAGRAAPEGEPLYPSRLLFGSDAETVARRVTSFFHPDVGSSPDVILPGGMPPPATVSRFDVPRPKPLAERVTSMRVTEFRDYLACPYRYYLRHRLGLKALDDQAEELDAMAFGSLLHDVMREFGGAPVASSTDADAIREYLDDSLNRLARRRFGTSAMPAVRVQIEQLRARLAAFARWQAAWAAEGWQIEMVETTPPEGKAALVVDGEPMFLRGRIDRIDRYEATGRRMLFDYKSSDTAATPEQVHRSGDDWVDLQLPLYRRLAAGLGIEEPPELGYIVIPKDTSRVGHLVAEWNDDDLADAERVAAEVIRNVRAEIFWPPAVPPPRFFQELAAICHDEQFAPTAAEEESE